LKEFDFLSPFQLRPGLFREASANFGLQTSGIDLRVTRYDRIASPSPTPGSAFGLAHSPSPTVKQWHSIFSRNQSHSTLIGIYLPLGAKPDASRSFLKVFL